MPPVTVRVPASSANLGPGYDSFGLALALHDTFIAEAAESWSLEVSGEGAGEVDSATENLVTRSIAAVFEAAGQPSAAHVHCTNAIPQGRGLGSSSAAIIGGLLLGDALAGTGLPPEELFRAAAALEGHPDNVAAALFGGLTVCWHEDEGPSVALLEPGRGLAAVVVGSDTPVPTASARALLPEQVPHGDAAFNAGRAGLLVAGLLLGSAELIGPGLEDRLHQPYRGAVVRDLDEVRSVLVTAGADGAALSGAGPTVIGLVTGPDDEAACSRAEQVAGAAEAAVAELPGRRAPLVLGIDRTGALLL